MPPPSSDGKACEGYSGLYFIVRKQDSEKGLSLLTLGRLKEGTTPSFWGSCDAICDEDHWELWGVPNCGKGNPMQVAEMSHGAAPARFRGVTFVG